MSDAPPAEDSKAEDANSEQPTSSPKADTPQENPLVNIMVNVLIPVVALGFLSKDEGKLWHVGPLWGMIVAVAFPVVYGTVFLVRHRKFNFFSILGIIGVLLTGGITLYVWNEDGSVKQGAALLFAVKEAAIPLLLGATILGSHWTKKPLLNVFLLNPDIFDLNRIEKEVTAKNATPDYRKMCFHGTLMLAGSLALSSIFNFLLALHFLHDKEHDHVAYNEAIAKLTGYGFLIIGVPLTAILLLSWFYLVKRIHAITGLDQDSIFLPR